MNDNALAQTFSRRIGALASRLGASDDECRIARAAAAVISRATADGHVCIALTELAHRLGETVASVRAALVASGIAALADERAPMALPLVIDGGDRLYLSRYYDFERSLADALVERARAPLVDTPSQDPSTLRATLERVFGESSGDEIDWQRVAAALALTGRLTIVSGGPGTGKTTTVVGVLACLIGAQPRLRIALAAPTGKAAQRMQEALAARAAGLPDAIAERLPQTSYTLHRLLGSTGNGAFRHHRDNPLPYDVVVVDEASMIDVALAARLVDAVAPRARLILLGDKDQLAAVEAGAVFAELSARPAFAGARGELVAQAFGRTAAALSGSVAQRDDDSRGEGDDTLAGAGDVGDGVATALEASLMSDDAAGIESALATNDPDDAAWAAAVGTQGWLAPGLFGVTEASAAASASRATSASETASTSMPTSALAPAPLKTPADPLQGDLFGGGVDEPAQSLTSQSGSAPADEVPATVPAHASDVAVPPLANCVVWLERNYRFGLDSPVGRLSIAIREGSPSRALEALDRSAGDDAPAALVDDGAPTLSSRSLERIARGFAGYISVLADMLRNGGGDPRALFDALNRFRVLCALRAGPRGVNALNQWVSAEVRRAVHLPLAPGAHWFAGRPIIVTRNDYALGLFNGDIGIALPTEDGALRVAFEGPGGTWRWVSPAALPPHDAAFALTVHKSQGSEFDCAALVLPATFGRALSRELVYTAVTRARMQVVVFGAPAVLAQAIATATRRDSGLAARLAHAARLGRKA